MGVEHQFLLKKPLPQYAGKWVAIVGEEVIAADHHLNRVREVAREKVPETNPLFAKVPGDENYTQL